MTDCRKALGKSYIKVRILDLPSALDIEYTYFVPSDFSDEIKRGILILAPFGGGNKKRTAVVVRNKDVEPIDEAKPIFSTIDEGFALSEEMMKIAEYLSEHTFCTFGEAIKTLLPVGTLERYEEYFETSENEDGDISQMNEKTRAVYEYIAKTGNAKLENIIKEFGEEAQKIVAALKKSGFIEKNARIKNARVLHTEKYALAISVEEAKAYTSRSMGQKAIVDELLKREILSSDDLAAMQSVTKANITALHKKGVIKIIKENLYRNPYDCQNSCEKDIILNAEQQKAYEKLLPLTSGNEPHAALLFGITGSGKTSVIKKLAQSVIRANKTALILVPEISLTSQTVAAFSSFGSRVAVIHSALSSGERYDAWRRIKNGEIDLVLGTRSAIFAPLENIGLIVIDEEQEHTYKSDSDPKYFARDIAKLRAAHNNALLVFASATPSAETFYMAKSGKYTLAELRSRYNESELPDVILADMRRTPANVILGDVLKNEIAENLKNGEQTILFLNRRGYNNFISCTECGTAIVCPNCSVSLTYHSKSDSYHQNGGSLVCHYCGYRQKVPTVCPECGAEHLKYNGYGTQLIEEELQNEFPSAKILRMDADTTKNKFSYREILDTFKEQKADILLGTQMVTKGHDFENVTLVGVVNADTSLFLDDYRANERTFSTIVQVIGRAGRAKKKGRAVIQTYNPENETILLASKQDFEKYFNGEIAMRKTLVFPPFCDIALFSFSSVEENLIFNTANSFVKRIKEKQALEYPDVPVMVFGPFEAPVYKIKNKCRMQVIIKHKNNKRSRSFFRELLSEFTKSAGKNLTVSIDINPNSL